MTLLIQRHLEETTANLLRHDVREYSNLCYMTNDGVTTQGYNGITLRDIDFKAYAENLT